MSTDAELVAGVLAGDREAFAAMYDRYADRLYDFCASVLRDRLDAEDAVQDTFVLVARRLGQLNDPERLRPWLYAVARSVALRRTRARKRVVLDTEVDDMADPGTGPHRAAELADLRALVWSAAAGLSERDRALLDLHLRQGLEGAELGEAMGVSTSHAYVLLTRLRDQVERSLGALLITRLGRDDCPELDGLLSGWDGRFSPVMRKRVARHVDDCAVCGDRRRTMVSPLALLAAVPMLAAPLYLRERVVEDVELVANMRKLPAGANRLPMAAAAATLLLALGAATVWGRGGDVPGIPLAVEDLLTTTATGTATTSTTPAAPTTTVAPTTSTTRPTTTTRSTTRTTTRTTTTTTTPPAPPPPPPGDTTPPQITKQSATPRICTGTSNTIQATASDNVGVTSVTVQWSSKSNGSGSTGLSPQPGGVWSGRVGPFAKADTITWQLTAADAAGNKATGAPGTFNVQPCVIG
ncbi:MAG: sigma-70 family RNA polymerase sigma factor [Labedaea sp.]